ncbi:FAD-dependent monooxygenase [Acidiferrobacter thiooxydans]|uniref:FAD-dependent monooxygenase n=1 Tax=Acidiferrobacter thiooxydans TaxID=163359 RepID=UPI000A05F3CF|nr:FAD-dependent monooxygenase [Acidiferrobacter thiooxydans]UEN98519.1 FAD-dependent monooxygenase [Acidiferrobacter thiooxydans]
MKTDICIVGGGPAGAVLALQLARLDVDVTLLESAQSYERSFRGESMQPDTVGIFHELGIAETLLAHGCVETYRMEISERRRLLLAIDYSDAPYRHKFVMDIPQPVLLEALQARIADHANARVLRGAACTGLLERDGRVSGVSYRGHGKSGEIESRVVIGADGRYSRVREMSKLPYTKLPMNRDVLWFKVPVPEGWSNHTAHIMLKGARHLILLPTYPDLFRAGVNIAKNSFAGQKRQGIDAFYTLVDGIDPEFGSHVRRHVANWRDIHLLDIFTINMPSWSRDGLLLIGDAAHTVTPLLGQGVNLAIQDSMELAPMLANALCQDRLGSVLFAEFQAKRQPDIELVMKVQMRQERLLCAESSWAQFVRRTNYAALHRLRFVQKRISDRIAYKRQRAMLHFDECTNNS